MLMTPAAVVPALAEVTSLSGLVARYSAAARVAECMEIHEE